MHLHRILVNKIDFFYSRNFDKMEIHLANYFNFIKKNSLLYDNKKIEFLNFIKKYYAYFVFNCLLQWACDFESTCFILIQILIQNFNPAGFKSGYRIKNDLKMIKNLVFDTYYEHKA